MPGPTQLPRHARPHRADVSTLWRPLHRPQDPSLCCGSGSYSWWGLKADTRCPPANRCWSESTVARAVWPSQHPLVSRAAGAHSWWSLENHAQRAGRDSAAGRAQPVSLPHCKRCTTAHTPMGPSSNSHQINSHQTHSRLTADSHQTCIELTLKLTHLWAPHRTPVWQGWPALLECRCQSPTGRSWCTHALQFACGYDEFRAQVMLCSA